VHYKFLLCLVLSRLIEDALDCLTPDLLAFLNAKLARRLVKLNDDRDRASPNVRPVYELMFATLDPLFRKLTKKANERLEMVWNDFKKRIQRPIHLLPRYADQAHLILTLPSSGLYLKQSLVVVSISGQWSPVFCIPPAPNGIRRLSSDYKQLQSLRQSLLLALRTRNRRLKGPISPHKPRQLPVRHIARSLPGKLTHLNTVSNVYDSNPEQKSIVLLTVMELCMPMVTCATELFSFLTEFNPRIPPEALDVLQLPAFVDICHLQRIGEYLRGRCTKCKFCHWTILEDPVTGCFAERYFDESVDSRRLQEFYRRILIAAEFAREKKEEEWKELNAEFEELERTLAGSSCIYTTTDIGVIHDGRGAGSAISGVGPNF
jgi:hypothetical protein